MAIVPLMILFIKIIHGLPASGKSSGAELSPSPVDDVRELVI